MNGGEPVLGEADYMDWLGALKDGPNEALAQTGGGDDCIWGALDRLEGLWGHDRRLGYAAVMPPYRPDDPLWAWFDDHSSATKCYRLASGSMVHVRPGCRCPR